MEGNGLLTILASPFSLLEKLGIFDMGNLKVHEWINVASFSNSMMPVK